LSSKTERGEAFPKFRTLGVIVLVKVKPFILSYKFLQSLDNGERNGIFSNPFSFPFLAKAIILSHNKIVAVTYIQFAIF